MKLKLISGLMMAAVLFVAHPLRAQENTNEKTGVITVNGEASMDIEADCVSIQIVSDHTNAKARDAYKMTVEEMAEAVAFLKGRKDIKNMKTTQVMLYPRVRDYKSGEKEYNARQTLTFELTDIEKYDELMLSLIEKGINGVGQVQFKSSKADEYEETLMRQAVQDARKKAVILASELGQEVGRAMVINVDGGGGYMPMLKSSVMYDSEAGGGPSVVAGNMRIAKSVNIQFELK